MLGAGVEPDREDIVMSDERGRLCVRGTGYSARGQPRDMYVFRLVTKTGKTII